VADFGVSRCLGHPYTVFKMISRGITMRSFRVLLILAIVVGPIVGCGSGEGDVPRTKDGLVPLPARPGPSQADQKAEYLKRSQEQGRPRG
jgi:hypothetical protein